jgi:Carboxypeptidase regulatory-like domain/TonB dependent receptor
MGISSLVLFLSLALPVALVAQYSSSIEGVVTDRSQAVIPNARVTVTNTGTGVSRSATTSGEGFYRIVDLGAGTYEVRVEHSGFKSSEQQNVNLAGSQTLRINATLEVGSVGEKITVASEVPQVETDEGRISGNITTQDLQQLPLNGRNLYNVVALTPGIAGRGLAATFGAAGGGNNNDSFAAENQPEMYTNGQRVESNSYMLDDMSVNSLARGGVTNLTPNPDSIAEVRVISNNFSAVNGRSSGGQVQIISKSGTNQFRGGASEYFQNNTLADRNEFEGQVPVFRRNEFDAYLGGPIIRNRTFFFTSFDGLRQSGTRDQIYTTETSQFANYVEQAYPNSIAAYLFKNDGPAVYPNTNLKILAAPAAAPGVVIPPAGIPEIGSVDFAPAAYRNGQQITGRIDHQLRPGKDTLYGNVYRTWARTLNGGIRPEFNRPGNEYTTFIGLNEIHIFSPTKLNELRADMMRTVGTSDIPPNINVPAISVPSISGFSTNGYPSGYFQTSFNYKDVFSWIHNSHTIKIGGELRRMRGNSINTSNFIPTYTFASIFTFAGDNPLSETRLVNPGTGLPAVNEVGLRDYEWSLFVNDDWKVTRNFTVNLGLRYENYESPTEVNGLLRNLVFGQGSNLDQRLATGTAQTVKNFFPSGPGNLAPRFGFAWDPTGTGKTSIRGGFGIAYDRLFMTPLLNFRGNPPLRATATLGPIYGTSFSYSLGNPSSPYLGFPIDPALQLGLNSANGIKGARVAVNAVDPNLKQAYTENWFVGVQRDIGLGVVVEADYSGSAGHHLYDDYDINRFAGDLLQNGTFHGFNPYFSNVYIISSGSNSIYQGATLTVKRRFHRGFTVQGSYTFSKVIDDTDSLTNIASYEDSHNRALDRGLAGFNVSNRLSIYGIWELPFFSSRHDIVKQALGGWQLSGSGIFQSGFPMTVSNSAYPAGDYNADGTAGDRPNAPDSSVPRSGFSNAQFLNGIFPVSAFPLPPKGTDGNLGRNTFTGPTFQEIDAALSKQFSLTERVKLQFRMEAFNVFNHVNLNAPTTDLSSGTFGKSTSTLLPRQFQAGLRLSF